MVFLTPALDRHQEKPSVSIPSKAAPPTFEYSAPDGYREVKDADSFAILRVGLFAVDLARTGVSRMVGKFTLRKL